MNRFRRQDNLKMTILLLAIALIIGGALIACTIAVVNTVKDNKKVEAEIEAEIREELEAEYEKEKSDQGSNQESSQDINETDDLTAEGVGDGAVMDEPVGDTEILPVEGAVSAPVIEKTDIPSVDGIVYEADVFEFLTLRAAPSVSADPISLLPAFTQMWIVENTNETMVKVVLVENNMTGYVNKNYITPQGTPMQRAGSAEAAAITDGTVFYADVYESLTLRSAASTSASELDLLPPRTAMYVTEWVNGMAKVVVIESGQTGYVNADYITSNAGNFVRAGK